MLLLAIFVSLFVSLTFAANWKYEIYVSSSFGVNTTSCWNGEDQTPCVSLNLALQGLQHNSTVIYLYSGTYILDNTSKVIDKSNVAIVGLATKDGGKTATITCSSHNGLLFLSSTNTTLMSLVLHNCGNIHINPSKDFQMYTSIFSGVQLVDVVIDSGSNARLTQYTYEYDNKFIMGSNKVLECPYYLNIQMLDDRNISISGEAFYISASVYNCNDEWYDWKYDLKACVVSGPASFYSFYFPYYRQCDAIFYDCDYYYPGVLL